MISKNLFINLQKEDLKRRIWLIVLSFIGFFLMRPIALLAGLQSMKYYYAVNNYRVEAMKYVAEFFSVRNGISLIGTVILAFFLGISGYTYLFNKRKTDFYHSLPIKRHKIFLAYYLNGIYIFLILQIFMQFICLIIAGVQGFMSVAILASVLKGLIVELIFFLFTYHIVILAAMLTGNLAVAVAGSGVLIFYVPAVIQTFYGYFQMYFDTYYDSSYLEFLGSRLSVFSPFSAVMYYMGISDTANAEIIKGSRIFLLECLVIAVILLVLSIWLYNRRPSEVAERAMAYKKTEAVIRILIVIPSALVGATLFSQIVAQGVGGWYWFGLIFIGVLVHATIEVIYRFDFKAALQHKIQLIISVVAAVAIALIFQNDILGYDKYLPKEEKVENAAITFSNINSDCYAYGLDAVNGKIVERDYQQADDMGILAHMKLTDIPTIEALAQEGIQYAAEHRGERENRHNYYVEDSNCIQYNIRYNLKNGKHSYRTYSVEAEKVLPYVKAIYENPEYKAHYNLLAEIANQKIDGISQVTVYNNMDIKVLSARKDDIKKLVETYAEEQSQLTIDTLQQENILLRLGFEINMDRYGQELYGYYVYPSFKKTIALLKEMGLPEDAFIEKLEGKDIKSITVSGSLPDKESYDINYDEDYKEITYHRETDEEKINELSKVIIPGNFAYDNYAIRPFEDSISLDVRYTNPSGSEGNTMMVILKGQIPEFIREDLK